jgi:hypothetical protein
MNMRLPQPGFFTAKSAAKKHPLDGDDQKMACRVAFGSSQWQALYCVLTAL